MGRNGRRSDRFRGAPLRRCDELCGFALYRPNMEKRSCGLSKKQHISRGSAWGSLVPFGPATQLMARLLLQISMILLEVALLVCKLLQIFLHLMEKPSKETWLRKSSLGICCA